MENYENERFQDFESVQPCNSISTQAKVDIVEKGVQATEYMGDRISFWDTEEKLLAFTGIYNFKLLDVLIKSCMKISIKEQSYVLMKQKVTI